MKFSHRPFIALTFLVASAGFLLQLWPLTLAGVVAMGFIKKGWYAIPAGMLLDLAYGAPVGLFQYAYFPFTIVALAIFVIRFWATKYLLDKTSQDRLS